MTVIKKSGKTEEFSYEKMISSIRAANAETNEPFDPMLFVEEFMQIVKGKERISTQHIDIVIYGLFYSKGLFKTLTKYISYDKK